MGVEGSAEEPALTARRGGSGPWSISVQPHAPATKPSGFPHFQMHTNRSKYRVLPGNAPAPQEQAGRKSSHSVKVRVYFTKRLCSTNTPVVGALETRQRALEKPSPVRAGPRSARGSRGAPGPVSRPGRGSRSRPARAVAPQTTPHHSPRAFYRREEVGRSVIFKRR